MTFYDPDNETFPIPLKDVDLMRQTQTRKNNVSENDINDLWAEAKGVLLSEEWSGTTRSYEQHFLNTKISKTTRPDSIWPEAWMIFFPQDNKGTQIAKWPDGEGGHERVQVKKFQKGKRSARGGRRIS